MLHWSSSREHGALAPTYRIWSAPVDETGAVEVSVPSFCEGAPLPDGPAPKYHVVGFNAGGGHWLTSTFLSAPSRYKWAGVVVWSIPVGSSFSQRSNQASIVGSKSWLDAVR